MIFIFIGKYLFQNFRINFKSRQMLITKPLNDLNIYIRHLVQNRLWLKVIIGLILGALAGLAINPSTGWVSEDISQTLGSWLNLPGDIFMKLVQMVMIPLIFASIISGLVSNVSADLKSFGLKLFLYFIFPTVVAIIFGIIPKSGNC
jgi:Na+/H+-dicarboxylate symporter